MKTCGTCKHWKHPRVDFLMAAVGSGVLDGFEGEEDDRTPSETRADEIDVLFGECQWLWSGRIDADSFDDPPLAMTLDASNYRSALLSRAEFGCVLHEEKD